MTSVTPSVLSSPLVVTPAVMTDQMVTNILTNQSQLAQLEQQLSTGSSINQPSDNPAGTAQILQLQDGVNRAQQYVANANDGLGWLQQGTSTMNQIINVLQSVQAAVTSATGQALSGSPATMQGLATQVQDAQTELIGLANTQYDGQAIFAGTGNVNTAYDPAGNYVGGGSAPTVTVAPGTEVPIAVTGTSVFGTGSSGLLGSTGILAQIANDLSTGTAASIKQATTTGLGNLQSAIAQVESQAAVLGANYQQMQQFSAQATQTQTALQTQVAGIQNVDIPQATTQLAEVQNNYQAALWAITQVSQNSLVKFLG
jgi:flagellar hook-associated protein 3 FlgL